MTTLLEEVMYESPDAYGGKTIRVTRELVVEKLSSIVKDKDLSRYVL
jgi:ATP-dependent protease HslVU (ClpYQ) ATPase subunit